MLKFRDLDLLNKDSPEESTARVHMRGLAPSSYDKDRFATSIMNVILGSGQHSRLYANLSEEKRLAYAVSSFYQAELSGSFLGIGALVPARKIDLSTEAIFETNSLVKSL